MSQIKITSRMEDNKKQINFVEPLQIEDTFFKWYDEARERYQWKTWVVAVIEFIGTFLMTFMIIAPSVFGLFEAETYGNSNFGKGIEVIFSFMFMRALWVAAGIWVLIILFHRISVNLNPAVTISEMAAHNHLRAQGVVKILAQVGGAIAASYIALYMGLSLMGEVNSLDSIILGTHNFYQSVDKGQLSFGIGSESINFAEHQVYLAVQFFMEFLLTFLLLLVIFATDNVQWPIRSWILGLTLLLLVSIGIRTDNIALNPARLIGPAMASATYNLNHPEAMLDVGALTALPLILLAELSAAFLMYYIQGAMKTRIENKNTIKENKNIQLAWAKILTLEVLLDEVSVDKKTLYEMSASELKTKAKKLKIKHLSGITSEEVIDKITLALVQEYLDSKLKFKTAEIEHSEKKYVKEIQSSMELEGKKTKNTTKIKKTKTKHKVPKHTQTIIKTKKPKVSPPKVLLAKDQKITKKQPVKREKVLNLSPAEKSFKKRIEQLEKTMLEKLK